jgi:hypothetical protein
VHLCFPPALAIEEVRDRSIWSPRSVEKTITCSRALVIATFSRRSPPCRFSGPNAIATLPALSGP